jgi:hypothetical protein
MTFILSNKDFWTVLNDKWFISLNKRCVGYVNFFCNVIFMPQNACSSLVVKQFLSEFLLIAVIRDYSSVEDDQSCGCRFPISWERIPFAMGDILFWVSTVFLFGGYAPDYTHWYKGNVQLLNSIMLCCVCPIHQYIVSSLLCHTVAV